MFGDAALEKRYNRVRKRAVLLAFGLTVLLSLPIEAAQSTISDVEDLLYILPYRNTDSNQAWVTSLELGAMIWVFAGRRIENRRQGMMKISNAPPRHSPFLHHPCRCLSTPRKTGRRKSCLSNRHAEAARTMIERSQNPANQERFRTEGEKLFKGAPEFPTRRSTRQ